MQIDRPCDLLITCNCGVKPSFYTIGYSRTPFYVSCVCGKIIGNCCSEEEIIEKWNKVNKNMEKPKPTRRDLIALLSWAANQAGCARNYHGNDRDNNGFEKGQDKLREIENRMFEAAGHFDPPKKSKWTE